MTTPRPSAGACPAAAPAPAAARGPGTGETRSRARPAAQASPGVPTVPQGRLQGPSQVIPWPLAPWIQPSNSPFPMGMCHGNTCAPGQATPTGGSPGGGSGASPDAKSGSWEGFGAPGHGKTGNLGGFGEGICSCGGSLRSLPTQTTQEFRDSRDVTMEKNSSLELGWKLRRAKDTRIPHSWVMDSFCALSREYCGKNGNLGLSRTGTGGRGWTHQPETPLRWENESEGILGFYPGPRGSSEIPQYGWERAGG